MWRSLIWKQWHEQAWRVAFASFTLGAMVAIGLWARLMPDEQVLILGVLGGGLVLPIFIAMGLMAPDRSDRTFAMMLALPVRPAKAMAITTLTGIVAVLLPITLMLMVFTLMAGQREISTFSLIVLAIQGTYIGCVTLLWTLCLTVRLRSEAMVGLGGIGVVTLWILWLSVAEAVGLNGPVPELTPLMFLHPFSAPSLLSDFDRGNYMEAGAIAASATGQLGVLAVLWLWALRQYRRPEVTA